MKPLPATVVAYKRTPDFDQQSIPAGLLRAHATKAGTWGLITVERGTLRYRILEPETEEIVLSPGVAGVIEPTILHEVEPIEEVSFYVEFYR